MDPDGNHLTASEVESYRNRKMAELARRKIDRHLSACEICLDLVLDADGPGLAIARLSEAFLVSDEAPFHMSAQDVAAYAQGHMDEADRVTFESHLATCSECNTAREAALAGNRIAARPAAPTVAESKPRKQPVREWWQPARSAAAYLAAIVALLACLLVARAIWQRRSETKPPQRANADDQATPAPNEPRDATGGAHDDSSEAAGSSSMAISLKDGQGTVGLDRQGNLIGVEGPAASEKAAISAALVAGHLSKPLVLKELTGPPIKLMDRSTDGRPFKLIGPIRAAVIDERPLFEWKELAGAVSYTVSVFDGNFERVTKSNPQSGTRWRPPVRLKRGQVYSWEVKAVKDNQETTAPVAPAPRAQFKVLASADLKKLNELKGQQPNSHLALGLLCARLGLLNQAETEFGALARDNPDSIIAKKLLADVRAWRPH